MNSLANKKQKGQNPQSRTRLLCVFVGVLCFSSKLEAVIIGGLQKFDYQTKLSWHNLSEFAYLFVCGLNLQYKTANQGEDMHAMENCDQETADRKGVTTHIGNSFADSNHWATVV